MVVVRRARGKKSSKDWKDLNNNWWKAVERNMDRKVWVDSASEQVDVGRLKQDEKARGWQPESSLNEREQVVQGTNSCSAELT